MVPAATLSALRELVESREHAGIFTDFDGTLSPIVPEPEDARPVRGARTVLESLARVFAVVAVVSGRPVLDLARRIRPRGVRLVGIHGLEVLSDGAVLVEPSAEGARDAIQHVAAALSDALRGFRGVTVEHKGLALAVHFRRAPDPDEAEALAAPVVERAAGEAGLHVLKGRRVLEVRPARGGDKGDAVRRLVSAAGVKAALVAGDDVGDMPSFEAVAGLHPLLRIAVSSEESPAGLAAGADLVIGSPGEFVAILRTLVRLTSSPT
jgi:trehalose 6-phosphate phosphatase